MDHVLSDQFMLVVLFLFAITLSPAAMSNDFELFNSQFDSLCLPASVFFLVDIDEVQHRRIFQLLVVEIRITDLCCISMNVFLFFLWWKINCTI